MTKPIVLDTRVELDNNVDGDLIIKRTQEIPDSHLTRLREAKDATQGRPMGNFHRFASIPVALVDVWMRQGFNINEMSVKEILKKLRDDNLHAFITTTKSI